MSTQPATHAWIRKFDLLTLRLFLTVAEEGSLNRAAAREAMTPSAATKRIQALEDGLGVRLIDRTPRALQLTAAGEVCVRHVRFALGGLDALREELHAHTSGATRAVTVIANASTWVAFLADDVARFAAEHADITLNLRDASTPEVVRAVLAGECDIGVCASPATLPAALQAMPYREDRLVAVAAVGHAASTCSALTLQELLAFDLIGWSPRGSLMRAVQQAAENIGRVFQPRWRMGSVDSARALVRAGLGIAILPESMARTPGDARLVLVPIDEAWAQRELHVISLSRRPLDTATQSMIHQLTRGLAPARASQPGPRHTGTGRSRPADPPPG